LIRGGVIGVPWLIHAGFSYMQSRTPDVRLDPTLGGGSLWDVGCYAVNVSRLIAGAEPISAFGVLQRAQASTRAEDTVDDSFSGLLHFPAGLVATVHSSFRAPYRTWLEVAGAGGVLTVANPFRPQLREEITLRRGDDATGMAVEGSAELFVRQIDDFVAAVLDGKPPAVSLADSRGNAAVLAALYASARTGRPVTI
jgi:D-xylose 1-dehydrogenase (NADP+, D-xylono-1,5-lactone-forming)